MKTKKQFEEWIKKTIKYYAKYLDINLLEIDIEYKEDIEFLQITCSYPYAEPVIGYSNKAFEHWQDGILRKDRILHELCHIITDPLYTKANRRYVSQDEILDERERLTDKICIIINNLICQQIQKKYK